MTFQQLFEIWNQFFHEPISSAPLALWRIAVASVLLLNAVLLVPLISDYFSADGVWPTAAWNHHQRGSRFSLLSVLPQTTGAFRFVLFVHIAAVLGFLLGYCFRICSVLVFLTLTSIHHRNAYILSSGDTLIRLLVFFSCFSDAAAGFSMDACQSGKSLTEFEFVDPWPLRLMQLQICVVYLRTVFWKLRGRMWWNGTAAWYPLWVDAYVRMRPPGWLLNRVTIRIATWGTLIQEVGLATLIWVRELRYPVLISGILFHLMLDVIMNLQFFSWIMICSLLLFIFPEDAERMLTTALAIVTPGDAVTVD